MLTAHGITCRFFAGLPTKLLILYRKRVDYFFNTQYPYGVLSSSLIIDHVFYEIARRDCSSRSTISLFDDIHFDKGETKQTPFSLRPLHAVRAFRETSRPVPMEASKSNFQVLPGELCRAPATTRISVTVLGLQYLLHAI